MENPVNQNTSPEPEQNANQTNRRGPTLSTATAVFSIISIDLGVGMVSVPKSSYDSSIPWTVVFYFVNVLYTIYTIHLLLKAAQVSGKYTYAKLGYE